MSKNKNKSPRFPLTEILLIIFVVAKITNTITWSWWWVLSPLWLPAATVLAIMVLAGLIAVVAEAFRRW